ncbi:MAG: hypothetical protein KatS3mg108_3067 [Isosphaeraceae bacterium]|jgi:hypothetical protein|nr:MAG: hypothetical protein KatS3mg108_3067 [Isosphaeraceae bacterium]
MSLAGGAWGVWGRLAALWPGGIAGGFARRVMEVGEAIRDGDGGCRRWAV